MKIKFISIILILSIFFITCNDKKEYKNPNQCDFMKESGVIKLNTEMRFDIIPEVALSTEIGIYKTLVNFKIFNYGSELKINDGAIDNIYSIGLAPLIHLYNVNIDEVKISEEFDSKEYGKWGKGTVSIPNFYKFYQNVFISPLAYKKITQSPSNESHLILVRFISVELNKTLLGVFAGDYLTANIINDNYSQILTRQPISFTGSNSSQFWSNLMPVEIRNNKNDKMKDVKDLINPMNFQSNRFDEYTKR